MSPVKDDSRVQRAIYKCFTNNNISFDFSNIGIYYISTIYFVKRVFFNSYSFVASKRCKFCNAMRAWKISLF